MECERLTEWLWDEEIWRRSSGHRAASEEIEAGCTSAVAHADGACKLDEITRSDVPLLHERCLRVDDVVDAAVRVVGRLGARKGDDGAVCASAAKLALVCELGREADGVVEGEAERFVHLLTTLAAVEEGFLDILKDGEPGATGCVGGGVLAVWAGDAPCEGGAGGGRE